MKDHIFALWRKIWRHDWSSQLYTSTQFKLKQLWNWSLKKFRAWAWLKPMTPAIPVQCSTKRVVKGGHRSRFTENKAALSQFTKYTTWAFHASQKIKENVLENHSSRWLWKSRFTRKKKWLFHISQEIKRADHRSRKYPLPPFTNWAIKPTGSWVHKILWTQSRLRIIFCLEM